MTNKIFVGLLIACALLMTFLTYYTWSWLQSIGAPAGAVQGYQYQAEMSWNVLITSGLVLLIFANVILWMRGRGWALWSTFLYFSIFVAVRYLWLDQEFIGFQKENGLASGRLSAAPLFGALLIILSAVFIFCDQFAVLRLHHKMYPQTTEFETDSTKLDETNDQ